MSKAELLIEIGVEELPAIPLLKIEKEIKNSWERILKEYNFHNKETNINEKFQFLYTPRRLVIMQNINSKQPSIIKEYFGPPLKIALKDGKPTRAGEGFAKKCGVPFDALSVKSKGEKKILYFKKEIKGKKTEEILPSMVKDWIKSMKFGKMMRWGDREDEFIRPIRWLQVRVGNNIVDMEIFGVKSDDKTYLHRSFSFEPVSIQTIEGYKKSLKSGGVVLSQNIRKDLILKEFKIIEEDLECKIEDDNSLLNEIVAITEHPKALVGKFDETFLSLPPEVIITSMKEHQRYFPVFKDDSLQNMFIVVSNALTDDYSKVISGNEKVLRPRLSDALFFYQNDIKRGLSSEGLENIQFIDGLGSLRDKVNREKVIALKLCELYMDRLVEESGYTPEEIKSLMSRAVELSKADLLTEMVYEFTELQGIMGYYYAKALGENPLVYNAIKEQYLPQGVDDKLPSSLFSAILALSIKIDTVMALFSVGKIPTGSKDPFGLRRAVNGIIRIVLKYDLEFKIPTTLELFKDLYRDFNMDILEAFFIERIYKSFDVNPSIIKAVLVSGEKDINEISKKIKALKIVVSQENFREVFNTFKRVANISKDVDLSKNLVVKSEIFESEYEENLKNIFDEVVSQKYENHLDKLEALFSLKDELENFFDNVLVNSEDKVLKENRQNLIASIYKAFKEIADIKEISI